ncbi:GTP-binding protein [Acidovorax sp.]|uniref:GTP-binding protein n=1 Tax=Acidovorax sp. TaxID=1872122 RepID=UPI003A0FE562
MTLGALKFITCGTVDDGKSTLIGRLLVDSKAVLQDHLAGVQRQGETDLALLTDGLSAEREQGITIDVAYRYFATEERKFIIGDAPGHEQYTRNMVTAASSADAAVVLVDATKLDWKNADLALLPQTRRHSLLAHLLRVHSLVFAVNKLDAVDRPPRWPVPHISGALQAFAAGRRHHRAPPRCPCPPSRAGTWWTPPPAAGAATPAPRCWKCWKQLPNHRLPTRALALAFPVQWVEKFSSSSDTSQGRRVFWGRVAAGRCAPGHRRCRSSPAARLATVAQVLNHARRPKDVCPRATAPASCSTARWTCRAATGCWPPPRPPPPRPRRRLCDTPAASPA